MRHHPVLVSALLLGLTALAAPAHAAPRGASVASLAMPLAAPRQEIISGILWKCAGGHCTAPAEGSRPLLVCQRLARTFGQVVRFSTPAGELSREDLSRCNGAS